MTGSSDQRDEFDAFVRARYAGLVRFGWALTGDRASGEDLAQATLSRLWARWDRVAARGDPWAYTQAIAASVAATWWRRRWRHAETLVAAPPDDNATSDEPADVELRLVVEQWLARLPRRQRAVVVLRFLSDFSVAQTAQLLGCSEGTVKSQTAKAIGRLKSSISAVEDPNRALTGGVDP